MVSAAVAAGGLRMGRARCFFRWWISSRVVCAWCKRILRIGGPLSFLPKRKVSHGCCPECSRRWLLTWRDGRRLRVVKAG